jgi:5'-nucleotidase
VPSSCRVLVTNDDGIDSPGLVPLVDAARSHGMEVVVAAPSWDSSGASASLTAVEEGGRVIVEERDRGPEVRWLAVEAAPAFIVRAAATAAFGPPPDVVLSGVNHGYNIGHAVLHSGTVGAVLTAATFGLRGMALSMDVGEDYQWRTAREVARTLIPWLVRQRRFTTLNVNVPNLPSEQLLGLRPAQLARFGAVQTTVTDRGQGWVHFAYEQVDASLERGTDAAAVADGYASVTALVGLQELASAALDALPDLEGLDGPDGSAELGGPGSA